METCAGVVRIDFDDEEDSVEESSDTKLDTPEESRVDEDEDEETGLGAAIVEGSGKVVSTLSDVAVV